MKQRWFSIWVSFSCAVSLTGCGGAGKDGKQEGGQAGRPHWSSFPVEIYVDQKIAENPAMEADVLAGLDFWERKSSRKLFVYRGAWKGVQASDSGFVNPLKSPVNQAFNQSPWPYEANVLALNMRVDVGGIIQRSLISINDNYLFCYGVCAGDRAVSFRKVLTHEIGHFLGLNHSAELKNIMFAFYSPSLTLNEAEIDWSELSQILR